MFEIKVTEPVSGRFVKWESTDRGSVLKQARFEAMKGAAVLVKEIATGRIIYPKKAVKA